MLVLTRKAGEQIVIGPNVTLTVLEIRGGTVKLGIGAPHDVTIHRAEVSLRIRNESLAQNGPQSRVPLQCGVPLGGN